MSDAEYEVRLKTTGRNDQCPCGSGKKYKKCHLAEDEGKRTAALKAAEAEGIAKTAENAENADDAEAEASNPGKSKPQPKRQKDQSGSKAQAADGKPKNIPRRGAV